MKKSKVTSSAEFHMRKIIQHLQDENFSLSEGYEGLSEKELYILANPDKFKECLEAIKSEIGNEKFEEFLCIIERAHNFSEEATEDDVVEYIVEETKKLSDKK